MAQGLARQAADTVTRSQLMLFHRLSDQIHLSSDDRRRALNLDDHSWNSWTAFMRDGRLPARPPLPDMLQLLGKVTANLAFVAD